jgi:uncharacterized membrane protein YqjE
MPPIERSVADVFQDIVRNLQDIVRAEMRLAKTEVRNEISQVQGGALALGIGVLTSAFALFFVLLAAVYGLSEVVPNWAASLIVAVGLIPCAAVAISAGLKRLKRVRIAPKTIESLKENVEWAKQQTK